MAHLDRLQDPLRSYVAGLSCPEFRERHIETRWTGDPVAVDTFFIGVLKGCKATASSSGCTVRPHQGRGMNGKTPLQAFKEGLKLRPKTKAKEEPKEAAQTDAQAGASVRSLPSLYTNQFCLCNFIKTK